MLRTSLVPSLSIRHGSVCCRALASLYAAYNGMFSSTNVLVVAVCVQIVLSNTRNADNGDRPAHSQPVVIR